MPRSDALPNTLDLSRDVASTSWPWKLWLRRHRTRKQLKALCLNDPDRLFNDLGIHPSKARSEWKKWFWQA